MINIQDILSRQIVPLPIVSGTENSKFMEHAKLKVFGAGFNENTLVMVSGNNCPLLSVNYGELVCQVPNIGANSWSGDITVLVPNGSGQNVEAKCENDSCYVEYGNSGSIESVTPSSVSGGDNVFMISTNGVNFPSFGSCENWETSESESGYFNPVTCPECIQDSSKVCVRVFIGAEKCILTAISGENFECVVRNTLIAGDHPVTVINEETGHLSGSISIISEAQITNVNPVSGSTYGGQKITVSGSGFNPEQTSVVIGERDCEIVEVDRNEIVCVVPGNDGESGDVGITVNSNNQDFTVEASYNYNAVLTPEVTSLSIQNRRKRRESENLLASGAFGDLLQISGSGFSNEEQNVKVTIGGVPCEISETSPSSTVLVRCDTT